MKWAVPGRQAGAVATGDGERRCRCPGPAGRRAHVAEPAGPVSVGRVQRWVEGALPYFAAVRCRCWRPSGGGLGRQEDPQGAGLRDRGGRRRDSRRQRRRAVAATRPTSNRASGSDPRRWATACPVTPAGILSRRRGAACSSSGTCEGPLWLGVRAGDRRAEWLTGDRADASGPPPPLTPGRWAGRPAAQSPPQGGKADAEQPVDHHAAAMRLRREQRRCEGKVPDLVFYSGAGDGNRTRMTSLEGRDCRRSVQLEPRSVGIPMAHE